MSITAVIAAAAAAMSAIAVTAPVEAAPRTLQVRYADLDMASADGRQQLDGRIRTAARRVCGWTGASAEAGAADQACRIDAVSGAQAQLATVIAANGTGGSIAVRAR